MPQIIVIEPVIDETLLMIFGANARHVSVLLANENRIQEFNEKKKLPFLRFQSLLLPTLSQRYYLSLNWS